ncbi:Undecaprenyl pyrophosphate synthase UppS [Methanonatronarchaeum thermophilum]|uniref:Tritrans,polycis-undecaprenyl-diphosphate synthase (geranylgeranyl-diphosphate specific) n=1 Tax=Methanonatronarchaeum thermophilum TaxID=1927129 RepID=A0A1Y3GFG1_9EURY|nr:polyprenyl diphosphate synthase [Methanonatronarchaeum thermophilum]OUJ18116.1 Undecaprenyl pyrophosphate synthase UppS [Methanonatronarchaeum thermophilum]
MIENPNHVAIIQDGNRRYAYRRGNSAYKGHKEGVTTTKKILELSGKLGIKHLTIYALSTENLNRDPSELKDLFKLFKKEFNNIVDNPRIHKNEVRVRVIGKTELLPKKVKKAIDKAEKATQNYSKHYLNVALAYGSKTEITDAAKKIIKKVQKGKIKTEDINQKLISNHMYPHHLNEPKLPDVELMIRTGGDKRISNFLMWQSCGNNSPIYFSDHLWPEFDEKEFKKAIEHYKKQKQKQK